MDPSKKLSPQRIKHNIQTLEERNWYVLKSLREALWPGVIGCETAPGGREDLNLKPTKASFQSLHAAALFKTSLLAYFHLNPG